MRMMWSKMMMVYIDMYDNFFLGSIAVGSVANLAFGGHNMDELYMMQEDKITKLRKLQTYLRRLLAQKVLL